MSRITSKNEKDIAYYTKREMKRMGIYFVDEILRAPYQHRWKFYTKWRGFGFANSTWEPVRTFVHDDGKVNEVFMELCLARPSTMRSVQREG